MSCRNLMKVTTGAYVILCLNSYVGWITWAPWASSLTMMFLLNIIVFIVMLYPLFRYSLIDIRNKIVGLTWLNIYIVYTACLSIYSLLYNVSNLHQCSLIIPLIQAMLSGLLVYVFIQPYWFFRIVKILLKVIPWLFVFLVPIAKTENLGGLVGFIFRPIVFILILSSIIESKKKNLYVLLALCVMILSLIFNARSNLVLPFVCLMIGYTINNDILYSKIRHLVWLLIILPFILFYLGATGVFNIFEVDNYIKSRPVDEVEFAEDTRTLVYAEVMASAVKNDYFIYGRGIGRGYESAFQERRSNSSDAILSAERIAEVGILNIFTWGGLIYVIIYTLMWCSIIYFGVYKSRNRYVRAIGFYLAFYYFYSWVENFQSFSIIYISSWLMVALCLSPYFRNLNNLEFKRIFLLGLR